ncbi:hypothetical protein QQS21_000736 [Conoideocrella luteorostrata]|uniref:Uncharacterized protein n=1 Tax=Conoideocrella luteorostrata TaxID=1105319 RepID=A0AAJ0D0P3_9HYPO|nr:hypothetical protein QQS21_000736 [Conoideocrella luteorostrata]
MVTNLASMRRADLPQISAKPPNGRGGFDNTGTQTPQKPYKNRMTRSRKLRNESTKLQLSLHELCEKLSTTGKIDKIKAQEDMINKLEVEVETAKKDAQDFKGESTELKVNMAKINQKMDL